MPKAPPTVLVATLERHAVKGCKQNSWEIEWHHPYWQAEWVDLVVDEARAKPLADRVVVVKGAPVDRPIRGALPAGYSEDYCPIPQMRSDMIESIDGMRFQRWPKLDLPALEVGSIEAYGGLTATVEGGSVTLSFRNDLGVPLEDLEIVAHFEGCYGKPGTQSRSSGAKTLGPGEGVGLTVPMLLTEAEDDPGPRKGGNGRNYRLAAVLVSGGSEGRWVRIDVRPGALGVAVPDCER